MLEMEEKDFILIKNAEFPDISQADDRYSYRNFSLEFYLVNLFKKMYIQLLDELQNIYIYRSPITSTFRLNF